jgi:predicted PurR-regulated permease PerM
MSRHTGISDGLAVGLTVFLILCLVLGILAFFGATIGTQSSELSARIPTSLGAIDERFGVKGLSAEITEQLGSSSFHIFQNLTNIALSAFNAAAALVLVVAGVFIALKPNLYQQGALLLLPKTSRARFERALGFGMCSR